MEERLEVRGGDVAEEGFGGGIEDGEVGVVAFVGGGEGGGDGGEGGGGEGGWRVEVFDCGLRVEVFGQSVGCGGVGVGRGQTPRYLLAQGDEVELCGVGVDMFLDCEVVVVMMWGEHERW